ncbi:MAG: CRISPR-associated protein Cas5 [Candidatus Aerophobetes bacterium]|nr:CRISPR-associated protein Cas5 [Candidatus Aerophobetes bacterium]
MWSIYLKIEGLLGHFRNPYTTIYKQSYPFPPKPAIVGMIGAMLGWDEERTLLNVSLFKIAMPEWKHDDKIIEYAYVLAYKDKTPQLRPERFEILVRPYYEIVLASQNKEIIDEIASRVKKRDFEFPIYMGKNEFLIKNIKLIQGVREEKLVRIKKPRGIITFTGNRIPPFSLPSKVKMPPPQVFIGVPLELAKDKESPRRILKKVYGALAAKGSIELVKPSEGFRHPCEVTVI